MFTQSQQIVDRYMTEVWNKKNRSVIYEAFAEDALIHSPMGEAKGPKAMDDAIRQWHEAFPDIKLMVMEVFENSNKVAVQWSAKGTHKGPFLGIPATMQPIQCGGVSMYRLSNDRIVEYWAYINLHNLALQLQGHEVKYDVHLAPI